MILKTNTHMHILTQVFTKKKIKTKKPVTLNYLIPKKKKVNKYRKKIIHTFTFLVRSKKKKTERIH